MNIVIVTLALPAVRVPAQVAHRELTFDPPAIGLENPIPVATDAGSIEVQFPRGIVVGGSLVDISPTNERQPPVTFMLNLTHPEVWRARNVRPFACNVVERVVEEGN
jgi:hypothetical protein